MAKKRWKVFGKIGLLSLVSAFFVLVVPLIHAQESNAPRKIVVFTDRFVNESSQEVLLKNFGATIIKPLKLVNGMAVYLPPQAEKAVLKSVEVARVDDDILLSATKKPADPPGGGKPPKEDPPPQNMPWGIDRIEADAAWTETTGAGIKVAVMDTGIDLDHPDLAGNIKGNVNLINARKNGNDDNGHGTHVAGIIAAVNNDIGVVGVGPKIYLYGVKVLDRNGSGYLSDLIEGLDWCISNGMDVVNMSLGASLDNQSFHDVIAMAYAAGLIQVASAGNEGETGGAVLYPARYPETIAVSAVGQNADGSLYFAPFSSYGADIDVTAPGVSINSTYKGGAYKILSGTSMAAPHVSGVTALTVSVFGVMSPDEMKAHLKSSAEDLLMELEEQGAGLIRADLAVQ
jgi:subtilisin family serine protease